MSKRERQQVTAAYERGEIQFAKVEILLCHCRSFRFSHDPGEHSKLRSDYDWRTAKARQAVEYYEERVR